MKESYTHNARHFREPSANQYPDRIQSANEGVSDRFDILSLFGKQRLEAVQTTLSMATGLATTTLDYRGDALTDRTAFPPFSIEVREGACAGICRASDVYGAGQALASGSSFIYCCPHGLFDIAMPIIVRGHYLGSFFAGQVRCEDAPDDIPRLERLFSGELKRCPVGTRPKKLYAQVPLYSFERFRSYADLIALVIGQLCEGDRIGQAEVKSLNDELTRVRRYAEAMETEISLIKSEAVRLKSTLNHYFVINTLNSISNLAVLENAPRTVEMVVLFAEYLKQGLSPHTEAALLDEEIANVERYLKMQKIRFGPLLRYGIDVSQDMGMCKIPVRVILPFVERAVFYSLYIQETELNLSVEVHREGHYVQVTVSDDGPGLSNEELERCFAPFRNGYEGEGIQIGIAGARQRLTDLFSTDFEISLYPVPGQGSSSVIRFPANLPAGVL